MALRVLQFVGLLLLLAQGWFAAGRGQTLCLPTQAATAAAFQSGVACGDHDHCGPAILATESHDPCDACVHLRTPEHQSPSGGKPQPEPTNAGSWLSVAAVLLAADTADDIARSDAIKPWDDDSRASRVNFAEFRALKAVRILV